MLNPKTEEIVKLLRGCVLGGETLCDTCVCTGNTPYSCEKELVLIAADRLEELEAAQPRWIPVTERLPDNRKERVIVMIEGAHNIIGTPDMDTDRYITGLGWVRWNECVTHWMPLPEPPKED